MTDADIKELQLYASLRANNGWRSLDYESLSKLHNKLREFDKRVGSEFFAGLHLLFEATQELNKRVCGTGFTANNVYAKGATATPVTGSPPTPRAKTAATAVPVDPKVAALAKEFGKLKAKDLSVLSKALNQKKPE